MTQTKYEKKSISYLAAPYTDPNPKIKRMRSTLVTWMAYEFMQQGIYVYSPLTHNVPIDNLGMHGDWQKWRDFDCSMLARCDRLIVLKLPGWEQSKGVTAEIEYATKLQLPIEKIDVAEEKVQMVMEKSHYPFGELIKIMHSLFEEREWSQFHSPKNCRTISFGKV